MKYLVVTAMILASFYAEAQCCQSQCEVKPACEQKPKVKYITKTKTVEKIVEKPVPFVVEKEVVKVVDRAVPVRVVQTIYKKVQKKNRISALGGTGPTKVDVVPTEVRLERGPVFGVQYQRMMGDTLSVGVQVQSNQTVLGSVGIDF